jgi:integrase
MLNLGAQQTPPLVDRVPKIHMLAENNVRTGFFEHDEFLKFRDALPSYLKGFTTFGYKFGWRVEEIANLAWSQVDRKQWGVRLEVGTTKNKGGRLIYLDSELQEIFKELWAQRRASNKLLLYVFPNRRGDDRIKDFRFAWNKAFKESKVEHKLFHDLRRTAVRNMIRAGVPEKVAMLISGHKTRSVFERYNIIDDKDLKLATEQQENYFENISGTISGTIVDFGTKKPLAGTQEASM